MFSENTSIKKKFVFLICNLFFMSKPCQKAKRDICGTSDYKQNAMISYGTIEFWS